MSKLDDMLGNEYAAAMAEHDIGVTNGKASQFARNAKPQIKALMLDLMSASWKTDKLSNGDDLTYLDAVGLKERVQAL